MGSWRLSFHELLSFVSTYLQDPDKQQQQSEEVDEEGQSGFICKCTDPTIPVAVEPDSRYHKDWMAQHERMVQDIRFRKRKRRTTIPLPLDFVMMGDSLVEHWNGTKLLGKTPAPAMRKLFESLFTKREGSLEGMALGSSMDKVSMCIISICGKFVGYR